MVRGYLSGLIAGSLVSVIGFGTVSVLTSGVVRRAPEAAALEVPAGSEFNQSRQDTEARLPAAEDSPEAGAAPRVEAPEPDDVTPLAGADTKPTAQPEIGGSEEVLDTPQTDAAEGGLDIEGDTPVETGTQATALAVPAGEDSVSVVNEPLAEPETGAAESHLQAPETEAGAVSVETGSDSVLQGGTETALLTAPEADIGVQVSTTPAEQPQTGDAEGTLGAGQTGESSVSVEVVDESPVLPSPQAAAPEAPAAETELSISTDPAQPAQPDAGDDSSAFSSEPDSASAAEEPETGGTLDDIAPNVTTNRLPSVGDEPEPEEQATEEAVPAEEDPGPPLQRYAEMFDNPDGKPLMAIVLIDDGTSLVGLEALKSFPYPLSFAVDAAWPGAAAAARRYRAAGFEVLAMADLPESASATDAEVSMQSYLTAVPEAVAVMEGVKTGFKSSRAAAEQLAPILLDSGHGLVMFPEGLNTVQKLIEREGVPTASVFRDFDAKGQNATIIRRFLDQAAFRAGQEQGGVIMVGRLRADTVSALLLWGLQDRAARVALAPVSAILTGK